MAATNAAPAKELTIDRIYDGASLSGPTPIQLKASPDGRRVTFLRAKEDDQNTFDLWEYNLDSRQTRLLVDSRVVEPAAAELSDAEKARRERARIAGRRGIVAYQWSPDGRKLLFPLGGKLYLYDLGASADRALRLIDTDGEAIDPKISPHGRYVAYVHGQNLWAIDLRDGKARQLTRDGGGAVHNAEAEFVAQEEMARFTGYWWAPDDSAIAFERFDETKVPIVKRTEVHADRTDTIEQRYPAAGKNNVEVKLGLVSPDGGEPRFVDLGGNPDIYLVRVDWLPDGRRLSYQLMQRSQQKLDLNLVDAKTLQQRTLLTEEAQTWINLNDDLRFLKSQDAFVWASERSGWKHLYLYGLDGRLKHAISAGEWNIDGLLGIDEKLGLAYVDSNRDFVPDRQVYALKLDGSTADAPCRVSRGDGQHHAEFTKNAEYYIDTFADPSTPPQVSLRKAVDGSLVVWIEENKLDEKHPYWPYRDAHIVPEFGEIPSSGGEDLYYRLYKPRGFDPAKRYPVFDFYYGGPHSQMVARGWVDYFCEYMAQHGYVVFTLDNRGMARRSRAFSEAIYRQLGKVEVEDQVAGIRWLKTQPYVDPAGIGVFGWSYGGYMTTMMLAKASSEIAVGVAVAPVTDWTLYDTFYTERYLGTPQDNAEGYKRSGTLDWLDGMKSPLLLVHGMADDNVLFANSTALMAALQERGMQFELMTYPGGKHGLSTPAMKKHVYHLIADYFDAKVKHADTRAP
ncbi:MAG: DPP IV N-terminal domain-containing protein [Rudaea sp.]|uniref:S9 family peptidase n=1 Tax=Rudaea sp. TaxID=2136325 RepID=UPI0039E32FC6